MASPRVVLVLLVATAPTAAPAQLPTTVSLAGPAHVHDNTVVDTVRGRVVTLGHDGVLYERDGGALLRRDPFTSGVSPRARTEAAVVFDPVRGHVLVFGGADTQTATRLPSTWTYDGSRWRQLPATPAPAPRLRAAVCFDAARGLVVLHGGTDAQVQPAFRNDTWVHDGSQWTQLGPATVPPPGDATMAYDSRRAVAVMVLAPVAGGPLQTWEWDGTDWSARATTTTPPRREGCSLLDQAAASTMVLLGGAPGGQEVWTYDGADWSLAAAVPAFARSDPACWVDPISGRAMVAGGYVAGTYDLRFDVWAWDGTVATLVESPQRPLPGQGIAQWWDSNRAELVAFGSSSDPTDSRAWVWNGDAWRVVAPTSRPVNRILAATTFDTTRGVGLMFGGRRLNSTASLGDLWAFDGAAWQPMGTTPAIAPAARAGAALCFDSARGVAVLFGGQGSSPAGPPLQDDTWEWDGLIWRNPPVSTRPSPRTSAAMVYDPVRGHALLVGGRTTTAIQPIETWSWDGTDWIQRNVGLPLANAQPAALVFDGDLQRPRLGVWNGATSWFAHDGAAWTQVGGPDLDLTAVVFDDRRSRLLLRPWYLVDLFEWTTAAAATAPTLAGCGAPVPILAPRTRARIGEAEFGRETYAAAATWSLFAVSDRQAATPIGGGCTLAVGPALATALVVADPFGVAVAPVPIPLSPSLRGTALFAQAGLVDAAGIVRLSNGLAFTVGD